jgi:hypothetical protein
MRSPNRQALDIKGIAGDSPGIPLPKYAGFAAFA